MKTKVKTPMSMSLRHSLAPLLLVIIPLCGFTQSRIISGKVSDSNGDPLPGATIQLKGTSNGTIADVEGNYSLEVNENHETLIISFVGMKTAEVNTENRNLIDVKLEADVQQLSEIVITALGLEKDRDKVGSSSVNIVGASVVQSGEPTLINGLSGKSSGLLIARSSGDPGSGSYIQIRGQSSLSGSVQPLIVVDGIPVYNSNIGSNEAGVVQQSRLNDLNPNDIESIEVLKGASASALWGTRAGNGVIVITTKKGNTLSNKVNINYSGTYSVDHILAKHPLQKKWGQGFSGYYFTNVFSNGAGSPYSYGDKIANRSGGNDQVINDPNDPDYIGYYLTSTGKKIYPIKDSGFTLPANGGKNSRATYDPYDALFDGGYAFDQNLSISGGSKDGNYYFSISNLNQEGIAKANSNYKRSSVRINSERQFNDWIRLSSTAFYSRIESDRLQMGNNINSIFLGGLRTPPDWDNEQGYQGSYVDKSGVLFPNRQLSYRNQIGRSINPGYDNPLWTMYNNKNKAEVNRFISTAQMDVSPMQWLTFTLRGGVDHYSEERSDIKPVGTAGFSTGWLGLQSIRETQFNVDGFAQGQFKAGNGSKLSVLAGMNAQQRTFDQLGGFINTFIITSSPPLSLSNATSDNSIPGNQFVQQRSAALYSTLDYEYKNQLFISVTGRAENSSVFSHSSNPTFFYPSITANWHVLKSLGIESNKVSFVKLRAGYGVVSTIPEPYKLSTYYDPSYYSDGWTNPLSANGQLYGGGYEQSAFQGNPELKPETKKELEFGMDFRLFRDKVSVNATYFENTVSDLIIPLAVAESTGFSNKISNAARIHNAGIELDLSFTIYSYKKFNWDIYGNWTQIKNKVTDLGGKKVVTITGGTFPLNIVQGYPMGIIYDIGFERSDDGQLVLENGFPIANENSTILGDTNPDWRAGIGSRLKWKNLTFNILFEHSHGGDIRGGTRGALINFGTHADTDHEVTIAASDVGLYKNYGGFTAASYVYPVNSDGSYTIRGYLHDFGGGPVLIDETWWTGLGGGFGAQRESFIESAQWTKLREATISYSLNTDGFRKKTKLNSVELSITGRNLLLWADFKGNDPETNVLGPSNLRGIDYFNNPATRSLLFTIKVNY